METGGVEAKSGGRDGRMDSFIFLVDLAYISPPPEADTKTNGLSSRSYKTSPPIHLAPLRRLPPPSPAAVVVAAATPGSARLAIECKCKTLKRRANLLNVLSDVKSRALVPGHDKKRRASRPNIKINDEAGTLMSVMFCK